MKRGSGLSDKYKGHKRFGCAKCRKLIDSTTPAQRLKKPFKDKLSKLHKKQQQKKLPPKKRIVKSSSSASSSASSSSNTTRTRSPPPLQQSAPRPPPRTVTVALPQHGLPRGLLGRARSINTYNPRIGQ